MKSHYSEQSLHLHKEVVNRLRELHIALLYSALMLMHSVLELKLWSSKWTKYLITRFYKKCEWIRPEKQQWNRQPEASETVVLTWCCDSN
jgi:hypothetical protein